MDTYTHNPYQQHDFFEDDPNISITPSSSANMPTLSNVTPQPDSPKPVPPPRGSSTPSGPLNNTKRRPAPPPPLETDYQAESNNEESPTKIALSLDAPEFSSEWDFPPLSNSPALLKPSNFNRTRSLCFRRKKKSGIDVEGSNKASTVPRRKFITDSDPDLRAHHSGEHTLNLSTPNNNDFYHNPEEMSGLFNTRSPRFEPVPAMMDEENVADITEKIITNINDHLERFEKGQNGELERDNKHLNRDNAMLREKIRMLEELLRENEAKTDRKLTEEQAQNRKFILQVEKERRAEIQNLQFRVQHLEKLNQDHEIVNQRLSSLIENLKKENSEVSKEIALTRETNESLQQDLNEARDKLNRIVTKVGRGDMVQKMFVTDINKSLLELEDILKDISSNDSHHNVSLSNPFDDKGDLEELDPKENLLKLRELVLKIREDKRDLKNQKEELMHNIMDRRFSGLTQSSDLEFGFGTLNGHGDRSRSGSNNLEREISRYENNDANNGVGAKSDAENTALKIAKLEKENHRLKNYIDKLLLIILETQPSLLEIKCPSISPERSISPSSPH